MYQGFARAREYHCGQNRRRRHVRQLIEAWPQLTADDIKAALKFAAVAVSNADFIPLHRGGQ